MGEETDESKTFLHICAHTMQMTESKRGEMTREDERTPEQNK